MVKSKGIGYTIEMIIAVTTVFLFLFGAITVNEGQNWSNIRNEVSVNDLKYTLEKTGYINHALKNGETGSLRTATEALTEKDYEVTGNVLNLPIKENKIGFYTLNTNRYNRDIENVNGGCENDLEEFDSSEYEELRTENAAPTGGNIKLYITDEDFNTVGSGDGVENYDSLYVDNGTDCQFNSDEGPYRIDEIFKWDGEYYEFKSVDTVDNKIKLYRVTQPLSIYNEANQRVNGVKTNIKIDAVNFTGLTQNDYDTAVFRKEQSVEDINNTVNKDKVKEFMKNGSILILADLNQNHFENGRYLSEVGFKYVDVSYKGGYSGGPKEGEFVSNRDSQDILTYFKGVGEPTARSIKPATKVISNSRENIQAGEPIMRAAGQKYNFSEWNSKYKDITPNTSSKEGAPDSNCYDLTSRSLTNRDFQFPEKEYEVINAELGSSNTFCNNNNVRGIKIDLDKDGNFKDSNEGVYLNGEDLTVDNRKYAVKIIPSGSESGCSKEGECLAFIYLGNRNVELISKRRNFPELRGQKIALTGYENSYSNEDLKVLSSVIYWLGGDNTKLTEGQPTTSISTTLVSGIQNKTYMPYRLNLRWSR